MQNSIYAIVVCFFLFSACKVQSPDASRVVGGGCEGCEGLYEYGNKALRSIDTLPMFYVSKPVLKLEGFVYQQDGKTPAPGVILYIYHTNRNGIYPTRGDEKGWAKRHGFIRGWIKTGEDGRYTFYTFRPAAYPDGSEPEHIHLTVKEPGTIPYYLDDYLFDDDPQLTTAVRRKQPNRGGSGIMQPIKDKEMLVVKRNIILGLNIPDY